MRENAHQNNSEYGHLLFSAIFSKSIIIVIEKTQYILIKSSRSQMLKISQYSKENTCWSLSLKKVGSLYAFFLSIVKFLRTAFLVEHLRWLLLAFKHYITKPEYKGEFIRTQSNIYDEAFLRKQFTAKNRELFSQKSFIVDVRLHTKYPSSIYHELPLINIWDQVFKSGPSKIFGRQPLGNLKGYGQLK